MLVSANLVCLNYTPFFPKVKGANRELFVKWDIPGAKSEAENSLAILVYLRNIAKVVTDQTETYRYIWIQKLIEFANQSDCTTFGAKVGLREAPPTVSIQSGNTLGNDTATGAIIAEGASDRNDSDHIVLIGKGSLLFCGSGVGTAYGIGNDQNCLHGEPIAQVLCVADCCCGSGFCSMGASGCGEQNR